MSDHETEIRHTILLVDDELLVRMNGADILSEAGYEVFEAGNAEEAIEILQAASDVELLFSDIDMPGSMNGLELAKLVHEKWPNIRLLLTSGHRTITNDDVPDDGKFLDKPYTEREIVAEVRELINKL